MKRLVTSLVAAFMFSTAVQAADLGKKDGIFFDRALVTKKNVAEAIDLERGLQKKYKVQPGRNEAWFKFFPGTSKVLVIAPHATSPMREGRLRFPDSGTGSLAIMLNRLAKANVLYTSLASPSDPNYYDDNNFKRELDRLLKTLKPALVLDLHGSHAYLPYDVDFGTMGGKSLIGRGDYLLKLAEALRKEGILNLSQDFFAAEKNATDTKWVAARGIPAIQLEINSTWLLHPDGNLQPHRFAQLLQALTRYILSLDQEVSNSKE